MCIYIPARCKRNLQVAIVIDPHHDLASSPVDRSHQNKHRFPINGAVRLLNLRILHVYLGNLNLITWIACHRPSPSMVGYQFHSRPYGDICVILISSSSLMLPITLIKSLIIEPPYGSRILSVLNMSLAIIVAVDRRPSSVYCVLSSRA